MKKTITAALAASLSLWASASFAQPAAVTCSEIDGKSLLSPDEIRRASLESESSMISGNSFWSINLEAGDNLSVVPDSGLPSLVMTFSQSKEGRSKNRVPLPFTYAASETETVYIDGLSFFEGEGLVKVSVDSPVFDQPMPIGGSATISCNSGGTKEGLSGVSTLNQTGTILNGLRNIRGRVGGSDAQLSTRGLFGFTADEVTGWRAWGYSEFRQFSNLAEGGSMGVTVGADRGFGPLRAGVLLSYDKTTLDTGLGDESVQNVAFGPYITGSAANFNYDAFVTMSRPRYDLIGDDLTGKRVSYGLAGEGSFEVGMAVLYPNLRLGGATEDLDGETLKSNQLAAGLRVELAQVEGVQPYLSIAYEGTRLDGGITGKTEHGAPRFGLGFSYQTEYGAALGLDIDGGETIEDLRDVGVRLSYSYSY
jgi:hypothetical protein